MKIVYNLEGCCSYSVSLMQENGKTWNERCPFHKTVASLEMGRVRSDSRGSGQWCHMQLKTEGWIGGLSQPVARLTALCLYLVSRAPLSLLIFKYTFISSMPKISIKDFSVVSLVNSQIWFLRVCVYAHTSLFYSLDVRGKAPPPPPRSVCISSE